MREKYDFEKLVERAVLSLPNHIREKMDNVGIVIENEPSRAELKRVGARCKGCLLGLYQGVPKTAWGRGFGGHLPDKITIFQKSIENLGRSKEKIEELVKNVVWHEVAHHFGFDERGIKLLEKKRINYR